MAASVAGIIRVLAKSHPFRSETSEHTFTADITTVAQIVEAVQPDETLHCFAAVTIGGVQIPESAWRYVYPKAGAVVYVAFLPGNAQQGALAGGTALTLAGMILIGTGVGAPIGIGLIVAGTALTLAATYLLAPSEPDTNDDADSDTYSLTRVRNRIDRWGPCPSLAGEFRFFPKIGAKEYSELIGEDRYLRVIFYLSDGSVHLEQTYIGDTVLEEFDEVETEFRRGYANLTDKGNWDASSGSFPSSATWADTYTVTTPGITAGQTYAVGDTITYNGLADISTADAWDRDQGKPFKLYSNDVHEESLGVVVTKASGAQVRTTVQNADEISIDIVFAKGLLFYHNSPPGKKGSLTVTLRIEYAPTGTTSWRQVGEFSITGRTANPLTWGHRWTTDGSDDNGQYDVRVTRIRIDDDGTKAISEFTWVLLRTITNQTPVPLLGHAMLAMRIRATAQINGSLDQVSTLAQSIVPLWNGATWEMAPTSNPAALVVAKLMDHHWPRARTNAHLDMQAFEDWSELCEEKGWQCNAYFDGDQSMWERLQTIAATGMANMDAVDGRWSVLVDQPRPAPVQMFTPTNTWGYSGRIVNTDVPHGLRQRFWNEDALYEPEELLVFADGYDESNASIYESNTLIGVTNFEQAYTHGRMWLARKKTQKEIHKFNADIEHMVSERGSRVLLGHTVIAVTLSTGRVKDVVTADDQITHLRLTSFCEMEDGKEYAIVIRRLHDTQTLAVETIAGRSTELTLASPIAIDAGPAVGDLFSFGIRGLETLDLLIAAKEPGANYSARIEAIPYVPGIYTAADVLPEFVSGVSGIRAVSPPVVESVVSDATVMQVSQDRRLIPQVVFRLKPASVGDADLYIWVRPTGTTQSWQVANLTSRTATVATIMGVEEGQQYDFRLQFTHPDYLSSLPTEIIGHDIVGRDGVPADLTGLTLAMVGQQAELRWTTPPDLDVQFGGVIVFRHSPETSGATWEESTRIGVGSVAGNQQHVVLPLKEGTYLAKVVDSGGRISDNAASVTTKQGSMFAFSQVGVALESPTFPGTKTNLVVLSNTLRLISGDIDTADDFDAIEDFDAEGQSLRTSGTYEFNTTIDLGSVQNVRITSTIKAIIFPAFDFMDSRVEPIDSWEDIDGSVGAPADAYVEYSVTDDDPAGSPTWGPWLRLDVTEDTCRGIRGRAILYTDDRTYNVGLSTLQIKAETVDAIV